MVTKKISHRQKKEENYHEIFLKEKIWKKWCLKIPQSFFNLFFKVYRTFFEIVDEVLRVYSLPVDHWSMTTAYLLCCIRCRYRLQNSSYQPACSSSYLVITGHNYLQCNLMLLFNQGGIWGGGGRVRILGGRSQSFQNCCRFYIFSLYVLLTVSYSLKGWSDNCYKFCQSCWIYDQIVNLLLILISIEDIW